MKICNNMPQVFNLKRDVFHSISVDFILDTFPSEIVTIFLELLLYQTRRPFCSCVELGGDCKDEPCCGGRRCVPRIDEMALKRKVCVPTEEIGIVSIICKYNDDDDDDNDDDDTGVVAMICNDYGDAWLCHIAWDSFSKHDDVIKWKHFPRYWPFLRRIHRSPVNSPHKGQWRGALMFSLICVWINDWVNNGEAGDLRRYRIHYDVTVMNMLY